MSDHILHIGTTRLVIASQFGSPILGVGELLKPAQRVATFESNVTASIFTEAFKRGLEGEGIAWHERRPGEAVDVEQLRTQLTAASSRVAHLRIALVHAERAARERAAAEG
jgi:hypothetical protein